MLLLKNGRVIDPVTKVDKIQDVLIDGNQIIKLGTNLSAPDAKLLDCTGLIIAPGLMDAHVHFRDQAIPIKRTCGPELLLPPKVDLQR